MRCEIIQSFHCEITFPGCRATDYSAARVSPLAFSSALSERFIALPARLTSLELRELEWPNTLLKEECASALKREAVREAREKAARRATEERRELDARTTELLRCDWELLQYDEPARTK